MDIRRSDVEIWDDVKHTCSACGSPATVFLESEGDLATFCTGCSSDSMKVNGSFKPLKPMYPGDPHTFRKFTTLDRETYEGQVRHSRYEIPDHVADLLRDQYESVRAEAESLLRTAEFGKDDVRTKVVPKPEAPSGLSVSFNMRLSRSMFGSKKRVVVTATSPRPDSEWSFDLKESVKDFFPKATGRISMKHGGRVYHWACGLPGALEACASSGSKKWKDDMVGYLYRNRVRLSNARKSADRKKIAKFLKSFDYMADEAVEIANGFIVDHVHKF